MPFFLALCLFLGVLVTPPAAAKGGLESDAGSVIGNAAKHHSQYLEWSAPPVRSKCPDSRSYAWIQHAQGADCIRYFSGTDLHDAPVVIVTFSGDRDKSLKHAPEDIRNNTLASQEAISLRQARQAGLPVIIMARPGAYGSSGDHRLRRRPREFLALEAGLSVLKRRYRIDQFVLLGHGGGATAAAATLTLGRTDIRCAVPTSGTFNLSERTKRRAADRGSKPPTPASIENKGYYDPLHEVAGIAADGDRRIYVLGNPKDRITPFDLQQELADAIARAGHDVEGRETPAKAPNFHDLPNGAGLKTATECARASY